VGADEFMAIAALWGFDALTLAAIDRCVGQRTWAESPRLGRYQDPGHSRVAEFERVAAEALGSSYALALHSGTSALETALVATGVGPGDEVILPTFTFMATALAVVNVGAVPVLGRIDESLTLDPNEIEKRAMARTKAVIVVHPFGVPADMARVLDHAERRDLVVIEDAAQALGGAFGNKRVGTLGHIGCFSVSSYKRFGIGEAGLLVTDDAAVFERAMAYHDGAGGWLRASRGCRRPRDVPFCGTNLRLSELEGAANVVQIRKLDARLARFRANKRELASSIELPAHATLQPVHDERGDAAHALGITLRNGDVARTVRHLLSERRVPFLDLDEGSEAEWHTAASWEPVLRKSSASGRCSWRCPRYDGATEPADREVLDAGRELVARTVFVCVEEGWTIRDCRSVADFVERGLAAVAK
jgi:dTDP-4-amino-4,6-dideoxygalactose transaminase